MLLLAQAAGGIDVAEVVLFAVFGVIALGGAIAVVTMHNIVHAALMLVANFLAIAALFLALQSSFLSIIQVIVYAGAIMVLFLFVIMLLGVDRDDLLFEVRRRSQVFAVVGALLVSAVLLFAFVGTYTGAASRCGSQAPAETAAGFGPQPCVGLETAVAGNDSGSVGVVADRLFGRYTFPFELAAVLLTVATIGAMLLGRRDEVPQADDPAWAPSAELPPSPEDLEDLEDLEDDDEQALAMAGAASITGGPPLVTDDPEVVAADERRASTGDHEAEDA